MVTMNLDGLDFEWFIAPHDVIEGYFEQISRELVLDQGLLLTQNAKEPARYRGATMIYDFSAAQ